MACLDCMKDLDATAKDRLVGALCNMMFNTLLEDLTKIARGEDAKGDAAGRVKKALDDFEKTNPGAFQRVDKIQQDIFRKHFPAAAGSGVDGIDLDKLTECIGDLAEGKLPPESNGNPHAMDMPMAGWLVWAAIAARIAAAGIHADKWNKLIRCFTISMILNMKRESGGQITNPGLTRSELNGLSDSDLDAKKKKVVKEGKGVFYSMFTGPFKGQPVAFTEFFSADAETFGRETRNASQPTCMTSPVVVNSRDETSEFSADRFIGTLTRKRVPVEIAEVLSDAVIIVAGANDPISTAQLRRVGDLASENPFLNPVMDLIFPGQAARNVPAGPFGFVFLSESPDDLADDFHAIFRGSGGTLNNPVITSGPPGAGVSAKGNDVTIVFDTPVRPGLGVAFTVRSRFVPIQVDRAWWTRGGEPIAPAFPG